MASPQLSKCQTQINESYLTPLIYPLSDSQQLAGLLVSRRPIQHTISAGMTLELTCALSMSVAYVHGFENAISGPIAQTPGENIRLDAEMHSLVTGFNVRF